MVPKYRTGSKIIIKAVKDEAASARDSDIARYSGQTGTVTNYHWISPMPGTVFYIYTVKIDNIQKEIVLHEDELEAAAARARK